MYEVNFEYYKGPIEKLLELVEENKLEITLVSLAKVTESFFNYLEEMEKENVDSNLIADFLIVASKLLLIKSKVILPSITLSEEEEEEIKDLEQRLKIYQEFKEAKNQVKKLWQVEKVIFEREFLSGIQSFFYPPQNFKPLILKNSLDSLIREVQKIYKPLVKIKTEIVNLKNKIEEVFSKLSNEPRTFNELHRGEKKEIIVLFLAILHLIKEQLIEVEQKENFASIIIKKV